MARGSTPGNRIAYNEKGQGPAAGTSGARTNRVNQTVRTVLMWLVILVAASLIVSVLRGYSSTAREVMFSEFLDAVGQGQVQQVLIKSEEIHIRTTSAESEEGRPRYDAFTYDPGFPDLIKDLRAHNVAIEVEKPSDGRLLTALLSWAPLLILVGLWFVFFRQMQAGGTKAMSFGKSKARLLTPDAEADHLRRRGRGQRGQGGARGDHRVPQGPQEVPAPGREDSQGRAADGIPGYRQDPARPGGGRRGRSPLLLDLRLGLRGDVRRRRRVAGARPVRAGQEERPLHRLHRRDRRRRSPPRAPAWAAVTTSASRP